MRCTMTTARKLIICGLIASSVASTGCKSGWKMPGMSLFGMGKKPSEETLAGKGPTTTLPHSPATTQTPSMLAGVGAKNTQAKPSPYAAAGRPNMQGPSVQGPSVQGPSSTSFASNATQPNWSGAAQMPSGAGIAATANGYTTGPYNTYGQPNPYAVAGTTASGASAPSSVQIPQGYASAAAQGGFNANTTGNQNGFGAAGLPARTVSNVSSSGPSNGMNTPSFAPPQPGQFSQPGQIPNSVQSPSMSIPNMASQSMPNMASQSRNGMTPTPGSSQFGIPTQGSAPSVNNPSTTSGFAGVTQPSGYTPVGAFNAPPAVPAQGTVSQSLTPSNGFRPGSTQRATGYDFSGGNTPVNTANGTSSPGYQLPPSTINR